MNKWLLIFLLSACGACTSDEIIRENKAGFTNIYKNILFRNSDKKYQSIPHSKVNYNKSWLSKYNQPIIALSSPDTTKKATLVALGNNKEKLTWVSADGISLSFKDGILIATRGYSQDLIAIKNSATSKMFGKKQLKYKKVYRYLNGENAYQDFRFSCTISPLKNYKTSILEIELIVTRYLESCKAGNQNHVNRFYVLPNTNIVLKSEQWVSPNNGSIVVHNYYNFQNDIISQL